MNFLNNTRKCGVHFSQNPRLLNWSFIKNYILLQTLLKELFKNEKYLRTIQQFREVYRTFIKGHFLQCFAQICLKIIQFWEKRYIVVKYYNYWTLIFSGLFPEYDISRNSPNSYFCFLCFWLSQISWADNTVLNQNHLKLLIKLHVSTSMTNLSLSYHQIFFFSIYDSNQNNDEIEISHEIHEYVF